MDLIKIEDKHIYEVWQAKNGDEYLVLDGLDPTQVHSPGTLETFMVNHYGFFAVMYWLLLFFIFSFLILHFLVLPLIARAQQGLPLFSEE